MEAKSYITKEQINCIHSEDTSFTFIGKDGTKQQMWYDETNHIWHTGITNEEYFIHNDPSKLESCKKCSLWESCRKKEYTKITYNDIVHKMTDDLAQDIDKKILKLLCSK